MNKDDELNKIDDHVYTAREHSMRGSTVDERYGAYPDKPLHLVDGTEEYVYVSQTRRKLREFEAPAVSKFLGLDPERKVAVVALNLIDPRTHESINSDRVILTGIYDIRTDTFERDPEILRNHKLSDEGRLRFFGEGVHGSREKAAG